MSKIPELICQVQNDQSITGAIDKISKCMIASMFYFKLDAIPRTSNGRHVGSGNIFCLLTPDDVAFPELFDQLTKASAQFYVDNRFLANVVEDSSFDSTGNFRKAVRVEAVESFAISLQYSTERYNISGSPYKVELVIKAQGLNAFFGRPDHQKRLCEDDQQVPRKKRRYH